MPTPSKRLLALSAVLLLATAACGSSDSTDDGPVAAPTASSTGAAPAGAIKVKVGIFNDATGPGATANASMQDGVKAGVVALKAKGIELETVLGDSQTSPTGAGSAAAKLIQRDEVDAVLAVSALTLVGAPAFTKAGVPVVGFPQDGPEWLTSPNMFTITGPLDGTKVTDLFGQYAKKQGGTTAGTLAYGGAPQSVLSAKASIVSAEAAGLKNGYLNTSFQFGGTNVAPVALAMKKAGVDAVTTATDQTTALALLTALRQSGAAPKVFVFASGYGGSLLGAGPAAIKAADGATFTLQMQPVDLETEATKAFVADLATAGITTVPTAAAYYGYASALLLGEAVLAAGPDPDRAGIQKALEGITSFDAGGLLGDHPANPNKRTVAAGDETCSYYPVLKGGAFVTDPEPLCGKVLDKTVTP